MAFIRSLRKNGLPGYRIDDVERVALTRDFLGDPEEFLRRLQPPPSREVLRTRQQSC